MTDDLVKRLRYDESEFLDSICGEAASRIEELERALEYYAKNHYPNNGPWGVDSNDFGDVARAALEKKND